MYNRKPYYASNQMNYSKMKMNISTMQYRITSGCKRITKHNDVYLSAWKKPNKQDFLSILVAKSKRTKCVTGKNGKLYHTSCSVIITNKNTGQKMFHWALVNEDFTTARVNSLGWVISSKRNGFVKTRNIK